MTTTEGKLYLTALRSLDRLEIQFMPKEIAPNRSADWADIIIIGRNNPLHHYTGGSNSLSLELDFHAEQDNREDVVAKVRLLESWAMNDGYDKPPERIRLTFGRLFKETEIWIIKSVATKLSGFNPLHGMLPKQAYVTLDLKLDVTDNRSLNDVKWN